MIHANLSKIALGEKIILLHKMGASSWHGQTEAPAEEAAAPWVPPKTANPACLIRQTLTGNFGRLPRAGQGSKVAGDLRFGKFTCRSASLAYKLLDFCLSPPPPPPTPSPYLH